MALERTLSIVKPDATRRNLTGAITDRLEKAGLREGANSEPQEFVIEKAFVGDGI